MPECTAEQNWDNVKTCILPATGSTTERGRQKQPGWFIDSVDTLTPLIEATNEPHVWMLQANNALNRKEFRRHQRIVNTALDNAREEWICKNACEGEGLSKDGDTRWSSTIKLHMAYAGRIPTGPNIVMNEVSL